MFSTITSSLPNVDSTVRYSRDEGCDSDGQVDFTRACHNTPWGVSLDDDDYVSSSDSESASASSASSSSRWSLDQEEVVFSPPTTRLSDVELATRARALRPLSLVEGLRHREARNSGLRPLLLVGRACQAKRNAVQLQQPVHLVPAETVKVQVVEPAPSIPCATAAPSPSPSFSLSPSPSVSPSPSLSPAPTITTAAPAASAPLAGSVLATGSEGSEVSEVEEDLWVYDSEVCAWLECSSIHSPDSEFVDVETEIGLETPRSPSFALDHQRRDSSRPGTLVDLTPRQRTLEVEDAEQRSMPPRYESSWLEIDSEDEDAGAILGIKRKMMRQFRTAIRSRRRRL